MSIASVQSLSVEAALYTINTAVSVLDSINHLSSSKRIYDVDQFVRFWPGALSNPVSRSRLVPINRWLYVDPIRFEGKRLTVM